MKMENAEDMTFGVLCLTKRVLMKVSQTGELSTLLLHNLQITMKLNVSFLLICIKEKYTFRLPCLPRNDA